jgi:hypothetical protein
MRRNDDLKSLLEHYFLKVPSKLDLRFAGPKGRTSDPIPFRLHHFGHHDSVGSRAEHILLFDCLVTLLGLL